jgi:hypothetical protein
MQEAEKPAAVRNTLALIYSPDLRQWTVRQIVLHHANPDKYAFQYVDWQFDGNDLIAVCRTAYDDGLGGAHSYHDANFLTFHRVKNFRDQNIPPSLPPSGQDTVRASFPSYQQLRQGLLKPCLLPGQPGFVFTMYSTPGELAGLRELVEVMRDQKLGNGFDPGPTARASSKPLFDYLATIGWPVMAYPGCADMQIQGGDCVLQSEDGNALAEMDRAGVFTTVQLGEWGYYFHNLAMNEAWLRDVYGKGFENHRHLMKPTGLAGFSQRPASKQECYDALKDYFNSRNRDLLNRVISVTGHSHYEAYAGEWGARCIGLEVGENIAFTQSKLAFARGASRQWQRPWSVQVSPWFAGACTTSGPLRGNGGEARGLEAGHSLSFYERMWLHGWFAGAAMVTPENSLAIFFEQARAPWNLTEHGRKAAEVFRFTQEHERGIPWMPVAIVLDHLAGYNAYMDKPWGILEPTPGDREVRDLFDLQLFPGSDHIHAKPDAANPEASYLRPTPFGEIFDVLLSTASSELLAKYPVILLVGDIQFDDGLVDALAGALRQGSQVLIAARHREALGARFTRLEQLGDIQVLVAWTNPVSKRPAAISNDHLQRLAARLLPVEITGDSIEYQINRNSVGWVVELINNRGVIKKPDQPAQVEQQKTARVLLKPKVTTYYAKEWKSAHAYEKPVLLRVSIPPGSTEFVELVTERE